MKWKWNESGFRPPLCTYRLNWARRTSWGWWDDWDDTVLQTQDSKFESCVTRGWGRNNFVSFKPPRPGTEPRTLAWKAAVLATTLGPPPLHFRSPINVWNLHRSQQTQNTRINFVQRQPNVFDVGPTLYKCYTNLLFLFQTCRILRDRAMMWNSLGTQPRTILLRKATKGSNCSLVK